MGQGQSFTSYEDQLLSQKEVRSYEVPNSAEKGTTPIYRSLTAKDGFAGFLKVTEEKEEVELDTAWKLFTIAVKKYGDKDFAGYRPWTDKNDASKRGEYEWMTYKTFYEDYVLPWGNGLQKLGVKAKTNVGLYSQNRPEWYATHIGNLSQSFRSAALYDTLGPTAVSFIVAHAECQVVLCEKDKLKNLFEAIEQVNAGKDDEKNERYETYCGFDLKYIVQIDYDKRYNNEHEKVDDNDREKAKEYGMTLYGYSEVLEMGRGKTDVVEPTADDLAYIMYTSGTTGDPKGVMLSHRCFAGTVATGARKFGVNTDDIHISYLPLAHIFETSAQAMMSSQGAKVAYFQGDIRKIALDFKSVRPTVLVGVPRVYGKTYDKFQAKKATMTGVKGWLVGSAEDASKKSIRQGKRSSFYDKVVWSKVPIEIGFDRVRIFNNR
jgi:long-chain acyl-CoA synthetase